MCLVSWNEKTCVREEREKILKFVINRIRTLVLTH